MCAVVRKQIRAWNKSTRTHWKVCVSATTNLSVSKVHSSGVSSFLNWQNLLIFLRIYNTANRYKKNSLLGKLLARCFFVKIEGWCDGDWLSRMAWACPLLLRRGHGEPSADWACGQVGLVSTLQVHSSRRLGVILRLSKLVRVAKLHAPRQSCRHPWSWQGRRCYVLYYNWFPCANFFLD